MAERHDVKFPVVCLEYTFDRLLGPKLEQAYRILVPERVRNLAVESRMKGCNDEGRRDLRQGIIGQAERGEHDSQPDSGVERFRLRTRV